MTVKTKSTHIITEEHLFISPHPDDESIWMGKQIINNKKHSTIVWVTSGAPSVFKKEYYLKEGFPSKKAYANNRESEAQKATKYLGVDKNKIEFLRFDDLETYKKIPQLIKQLTKITTKNNITHIHTSCYEGNHPDHDTIRFAAWYVAKDTGTTLIEYSNNLARNDRARFEHPHISEFNEIKGTETDIIVKKNIFQKAYLSQNITLNRYNYNEYNRIAKNNNYSKLKNATQLHYETISLIKVTRKDVLNAFKQYENEKNQ